MLFKSHNAKFKLLRDMISADAQELDHFHISEDKIGKYTQSEKGWSKKYGEYVPFSVVTGTYNLNNKRHQDYVNILQSIGASAVNYYNGNVSITVFSAGFVFGGCSSDIIFQPTKINLEQPSWSKTYFKVYFDQNWGGETKCS